MAAKGQQPQAHAGEDAKDKDSLSPAPPHDPGHAFPIRLRFFEEFKRRNLARVGILYLIACWVILEPTHVVFHMLEVPEWANRLVIILMATGFPLVLLFSWVYELTPEGLKPTADVDRASSITRQTGRRLDRAIIAVLSLALVYFVADKFWLSRIAQKATTASSAALPASDKSIAVLPFVDLSEKKDQEYFSDGLSEELIDRLAHSQDLKVIARTSSFQFKGKNEDMRSIAGKLGVAHLLEGSVRKDGSTLRITAQLIRASDGTHLWSQTYERNVSSVFKVQDEIAGTVAGALRVALAAGDSPRTEELSSEAYNQFLQGEYFLKRGTRADNERAIDRFKQAIQLDPGYAMAWAKLSDGYFARMAYGSSSIDKDVSLQREAVARALKIDPNLAYAHKCLAILRAEIDWDWGAARAEYERARMLDPDADGLKTGLASLAMIFGRFDDAIAAYRQVLSRDPLDADTTLSLGWALLYADRLQEAAATYRKVLELRPDFASGQAMLGLTLLFMGRQAEALGAAEKEPEEGWRIFTLPAVYWAMGRRAESDAALGELTRKYAAGSAYQIAELHAYRGEADAAFEWLDRAYRQRDAGIVVVKVDPMLRNLHRDPRYHALLVKMKLSDEQLQASAGA